jgi:hypothetical protein
MGVSLFLRRFPTMGEKTKADEAEQHHCPCRWQRGSSDPACCGVIETKSFPTAHRFAQCYLDVVETGDPRPSSRRTCVENLAPVR